MLEKLSELGIRKELIDEIAEFRNNYPVEEAYTSRISIPEQFYYGKDVWEQAITALLCGENILLVAHKATGKNIFAENLAGVFWDLQKKCENVEISSKALDLRGLLGAIGLMEKGLEVHTALDMGITNKSFDPYEQTLIRDTIRARQCGIPAQIYAYCSIRSYTVMRIFRGCWKSLAGDH